MHCGGTLPLPRQMAGLHAPRAGLPLKGAAVLMDPQARQALPMLPYGGGAGGAGEVRCREGLRQGSGAAAQGSAVRRSARGSTSCSKKSRRRQYGARRSPISCRGDTRGGQKVSLMRELDMLELMCKLMQGAIELPGKGTGGDLAGGLTNGRRRLWVTLSGRRDTYSPAC